MERQVLDPTSDLYQHKAQYTIVFQSTHKLMERYAMMSADEQVRMADDRLDFIRIICAQVSGHIVYYNYRNRGHCLWFRMPTRYRPVSLISFCKLNYELLNLAQECQNLFICDLCGLQNKFGRDMMYDSTVYMSTEMVALT